MDFFEAAAKRSSYREAFADAPVPESDLRKILQAGIQAPSGYNMQSTSFVAVTDPALLEQLAQLLPTPATKTAKAMIVVVTEEIAAACCELTWEKEDYAAAVENILLGITALGYAGVWMDGMTRMGGKDAKAQQIAALLHVPEGKRVRTIIPIGVPAKAVPQKEKKPFAERVVWQTY